MCVRTHGEPPLRHLDTNDDGVVNLEEWKAGLTPELMDIIARHLDDRGLLKGFEQTAAFDFTKVFMQFDIDGSGKLDMLELKRAFLAMGLDLGKFQG